MSEMRQGLPFSTSLSLTLSRSIHVVANGRLPFLFRLNTRPFQLYIHRVLFIHSAAGGHLGCLHTLALVTTALFLNRCLFASFLTIALQTKLVYLTSILEVLTRDLMEQSSNMQPKLMLRRTESVVEKLLTNWMSVCLSGFLRVSVASRRGQREDDRQLVLADADVFARISPEPSTVAASNPLESWSLPGVRGREKEIRFCWNWSMHV